MLLSEHYCIILRSTSFLRTSFFSRSKIFCELNKCIQLAIVPKICESNQCVQAVIVPSIYQSNKCVHLAIVSEHPLIESTVWEEGHYESYSDLDDVGLYCGNV